jgi:hypothetical protein
MPPGLKEVDAEDESSTAFSPPQQDELSIASSTGSLLSYQSKPDEDISHIDTSTINPTTGWSQKGGHLP